MTKLFSFGSVKCFLVSAVLALTPAIASALSVTPGDIRTIESGTGTVVQAGFTGSDTFGLEWAAATSVANKVRYYQQFSVSENFELFLSAYAPMGGGVAMLLPGLVTAGGSGQALAIEKPGSDDVGSSIFGKLDAGDYTLFFIQFKEPVAGAASFTIAAVPLPLGAVLLTSALGGLVLLRRRQTAA